MKPRVLFILKYREDYGDGPYGPHVYNGGKGLSSGLLNSAKFVVDMLAKEHIEVKLVQVVDNNDIDREVFQYRPSHVIIEALWVVPDKFDILQRLHPHVRWIVRGHSEIPFLANEGVAINWLTRYVRHKNVSIAANSDKSLHDLRSIVASANPDWTEEEVEKKVRFLPNFYPYNRKHIRLKEENGFLDVACFGAIRPLKNQLIQAVAAIKYAESQGKLLRFHINGTRSEQGGNNVLKNLRALFEATEHELVMHDWLPHHAFLHLLAKMDISLCVSFSESFCIVAADSIVVGVPIVGSPEIAFLNSWAQAVPTSSEDIVHKMCLATNWKTTGIIAALNARKLHHQCSRAIKAWLGYLFS